MGLFNERKSRLLTLMKENKLKSVILSPSANMYYITGFSTFPGERFLASVIVDTGEVIFIVPKLYEQEVKENAYYDSIMTWDDSQNPLHLLEDISAKYGLRDCNIAIEDTMWFTTFEKILKTCNNAAYKMASDIIGQMRITKSEEELKKLRKASQLADNALSNIMGSIKAGITELKLKELLEQEMKVLGLSAPSFDTIIGSGSNSALPHYSAGNKIINEGDAVVIDFGGIFEGYCSDMTRTIIISRASTEYKEVYNIVKEAQQKAIEAVKPGVKACEIDAAARNYITERGYGKYFIHRTGHGIGLEVHETPYIAEKSDLLLKPGMVFSIEPGVYLPEKFGVRIEDLVVVTESGAEVLNSFSKELQII